MAKLNQTLRGIKISQATSNQPAKVKPFLPTQGDPPAGKIALAARTPIPGQDHAMGCISNLFLRLLSVGGNLLHNTSQRRTWLNYRFSSGQRGHRQYSQPTYCQNTFTEIETDPFRQGATISLPRTEDDLCPVATILTWLVYRGKLSWSTIPIPVRRPLTRPRLVIELRKVLGEGGSRSRAFLRAQFPERCRHDSHRPRDLRLPDKTVRSMEEFGVSTIWLT